MINEYINNWITVIEQMNNTILETIIKLEATKLQAFLYSFANMIDDIGIDEAVKKVNSLL